jgi:hypothetical protein
MSFGLEIYRKRLRLYLDCTVTLPNLGGHTNFKIGFATYLLGEAVFGGIHAAILPFLLLVGPNSRHMKQRPRRRGV